MRIQLRFLLASAAMVGCVAASACGGGGGSSPPTTPSTTPSTTTTATIIIVGQNGAQAFSPNPASFGGQQIVFKNNDTVSHRIVLNDGSLDTGDIAPGATSRAVTMPDTGTNYHCSLHTGMIGSVSAGGAAPPPCTGPYCTGY